MDAAVFTPHWVGREYGSAKRPSTVWGSASTSCLPRRKARKIHTGQPVPLRAEQPNRVWTYNLVIDRTLTGQPLKILTLQGEFNWQSLALRREMALRSANVKAVLVEVGRQRSVAALIRGDNGLEFIAHSFKVWLAMQEVDTRYVDPGKPRKTVWRRVSTRGAATSC